LAAITWPTPAPGLVIRYSYLWHSEAVAGRDEGSKDRSCAIILAVRGEDDRTRVYVLPITHAAPRQASDAVEIPPVLHARFGLDDERSWVVVTEANVFDWPGPDLRALPGKGTHSAMYGYLAPRFFRFVRDQFLAINRGGKAALVHRTE
jgi:hypothetical protein